MAVIAQASPASIRDQHRETFRQFLGEKGMRVTSQRLAIFEAAFNLSGHFTAEELLEHARRIDRSVSRATVYRSLPILTESSLVREIDVGRDYKVYQANHDQRPEQAQVVCLDCDQIFEIDAPFLGWYGKTAAQKLGLVPEFQRLQVHARCARLRSTGNCEHRPAGAGART